ncbi:hypothetical protein COCOBI_03-6720 [Coccomyxa sp. Obi]|nr:hypothetical protein COCOBI_03-6720 [Coccomyxa sp. Obi]
MSRGYYQTDLAGNGEFLVPPDSRTPEQFNADLRDLNRLPELRKRLAAETKLFCDKEHPLSKKAEQMGFRRTELMHPHLIKGKEIPRDLEDWGKRMLAWVYLSAKVSCLEELKKTLAARASKSSQRSGMWSSVGVMGRNTWASIFS